MKTSKYLLFFFTIIVLLACKQSNEDKLNSKESPLVISKPEDLEKNIGKEKTLEFVLDNLLQYNSEAELKEAFKGQVKRAKGYYPEGMGEYTKTVLFPDTKNEVEFIWKDDSIHFNQLLEVKVFKDSTRWKTKEGITIGTNLKTLEKLNEKPFLFYGFEWDYGGIVNWNDGYFLSRNVAVCLALPETVDFSDYEKLLGDSEFKSNSKIAQEVNPTVSELSLIKK